MKRTLALAAIALGVLIPTSASAAPTFDSDCVGTQWVIRNRGTEPFLVAAPSGAPIGMIEVGATWEPDDNLASVIIADTVIPRGGCEVFASPPTPARSQLPATGASSILALLAFALTATGALAWRVGRN